MALEVIHTYLVHPSKGLEVPPDIPGAKMPLTGKLYDVVREIYQNADHDCDISIAFDPNEDGDQQNDCRDLFTGYLNSRSEANGRKIAARLGEHSTNRSGMALVFVMAGTLGKIRKLVVSRFPAESGILADESKDSLKVEFLERVFMKDAKAYKAVAFQGVSLEDDFWKGLATDKQIGTRNVQISDYWIRGFLAADFRTTSALGTRRLAVAMRDAAKKVGDVEIKSAITSAATLAGKMDCKKTTVAKFAQDMGMPPAAAEAVVKELKIPALASESFQFSHEEFTTHVAFRSVELDSGGMLTAQSSDFDVVFDREIVDEDEKVVRYSTQGRVLGEKLGKTK